MTRSEKIAANKADKRVDAAYRARCSSIPVNVMDIGKIFKVGRAAIAEGVTDEVLGDRVYAYVQTIRL